MYDPNFYDSINKGSVLSAREIIPEVLKVFPTTQTVVDFGCGEGAWLSVFKEHECAVKGIDGYHVNLDRLLIEHNEFEQADLTFGFRVNQRYDMAISLEVAEHLPETSADQLVQSLCIASNVILFSAAIPGQNGEGHINEQWPSYWNQKFKENGYVGTDYFRWLFWNNPNVENWYKQNILLYISQSIHHTVRIPRECWQVHDVVHPNNWRDHYLNG